MKNRIFFLTIVVLMCVGMMQGSAQNEAYIMHEESLEEDGGIDTQSIDPVSTTQETGAAEITGSVEGTGDIYVDICGAVKYPGVYSLPKGARVFEAIDAAGGLLEDACMQAVNRAEPLNDGQKIYIMNETEWQEAQAECAIKEDVSADDGRININTASEDELCTLPGIGLTRAKAIIAYREEYGSFSAIEEIQNVSGIKSGTYEKICSSIKVQ